MKNNITELRKAKKLSMQALADLVGTTQQQIDRLEKGKRKLSAEWIEKLCNALACDPLDLVDFSLSPANSESKKPSTTIATIIGAIETGFSNKIRKFAEDEKYRISFRGDKEGDFFGLIVEGGNYGKYPDGTELVFNELSSETILAGAAESDSSFISTKNDKQHQFEIDGKLVKAALVKSIRSE